jgi:hypothetical protein
MTMILLRPSTLPHVTDFNISEHVCGEFPVCGVVLKIIRGGVGLWHQSDVVVRAIFVGSQFSFGWFETRDKQICFFGWKFVLGCQVGACAC